MRRCGSPEAAGKGGPAQGDAGARASHSNTIARDRIVTLSRRQRRRVLLELPAAAELDEVLSTMKNEIKFEEASSEKSGGLIKKLDDQDFKEKGTAFPEAMKAPDGCCGGSSSGEIEYDEASSCCGGNKSVDW